MTMLRKYEEIEDEYGRVVRYRRGEAGGLVATGAEVADGAQQAGVEAQIAEREGSGVERRRFDVDQRREEVRPRTASEVIGEDLTEYAETFGTQAERVARLFTGPVKSGIEAARNAFQGLLGDTDYWSQRLGTIPGSIMGAITGSISEMFAAWIAGRLKQSGVHLAQLKLESIAEIAAKTPGAILSSISSFGAAAIVGVAAVTAALAGLGAFASGGPIGGGRQLIWANEQGEEFMLRAEARSRFGDQFLARLNAGVLDLGSLPDDVAASMPRPYQPRRESSARFGGEGANAAPVYSPNLNVAMVNSASEMREFMRREGSKMAFDYSTRRTRTLS